MRKNVFVKISAVLASVVMAVSAGVATASAAETTAVKQCVSSDYSIEFAKAQALSGKDVSLDLNLFSNNSCEGYTFTVEFDDELEFKEAYGVSSYNQYGNTIEISGFSIFGIQDGNIGTLRFTAPDDFTGKRSYEVKITNVESFGNTEGEFTDFSVVNSTIEVVGKGVKTSDYIMTESKNKVSKLGIRGDYNDDGKVNVFDAMEVAKASINNNTSRSNEIAVQRGDVNEDGNLNIFDAVSIARYTLCSDWSKSLG